ncbi:hypothetical protein GW17_00061290 [Ensete ventricosum]|nr:hypothetical protein GW17_00061290 [Ensete ventricosum]
MCALACPRSTQYGVGARSDRWYLRVRLGKPTAGMVELGGRFDQELGNLNGARADSTEHEPGNWNGVGADPTKQGLRNLNGVGADPTKQGLENLNVVRADPTEHELGNWNGIGADPTKQGLGNLNVARADPTEQELGNLNLGFCQGGELGRKSGDLAERVNSGANPGIGPNG